MALAGILGNVFLAVFKLFAGIIGHSTAMLSDSVHTLSDIFATVIALIGVKEAMFWYTMHYAKQLRSSAFRADAWHHRSDALSSVGALVGVIGARNGYPILDQVAGLIICVMILGVAIGIFKDAAEKMLDTACDETFETSLRELVYAFSEKSGITVGIDDLKTRKFGEKIYVEMEIRLDGDMRLQEAHNIAERLHDDIEQEYADVKHVMIHVNPAEA